MVLKIYFAGSIRGGRGDKKLYLQIIELLREYGEILTEHVGDQNLSSAGEENEENTVICKRDLDWLDEADVVVAEVSTPSNGVGFEVGRIYREKPVLCLYRTGSEFRLSPMIGGNTHINITNRTYSKIQDLHQIFKDFFSAKGKS